MQRRPTREQIAQQPPLKRRASAEQFELLQRTQEPATDEEEISDAYYPQRMPTSTRRYIDTRGNQVIQQGNRRVVIHDEPPPKKKSHWLLFIGLGMLAMVTLWFLLQLGGVWWTNEQLNATYQYPRMYQADEVVGHGDSTDHPTHFIFENLRGQIIIIELPGGDYSHARIYKGPTLFSDNADQIPVTAEFKDVNGDGKVDIILHIQNQRVVFYNTGTEFKEQ
jgi:hypothetical protein